FPDHQSREQDSQAGVQPWPARLWNRHTVGSFHMSYAVCVWWRRQCLTATLFDLPCMGYGEPVTDSLGQFEQIVLTAILALDDNAYGVTIHAKVEDLSRPKKVTRGAVYATLDRMEDKGLISSWLSEPTKERGGRSRRHYRIEKSGEKALRESARTAQRLIETIAQALGGLAWKPR